jgi:predicted TIM-barrel fold metal-dependent hydrolase
MGAVSAAPARRTAGRKVAQSFVDCDVHNAMPDQQALLRYLPKQLHSVHEANKGEKHLASSATTARGGGRVIGSMYHSRPRKGTFRWDATPPSGLIPGSDPDFFRQDYLEMWPVHRAILAPLDGNSWPQAGEYAAALAAAENDWNAAEWMRGDERLHAAIIVPSEDPERSANEVRRMARNPRFVQVLMPARTRDPLGHTKYWPLYEAAAETGRPIALHVGGAGNPISGAGWPSYHFEYHAAYHHAFQSQLVSLVTSGVFKEYPRLKFVLEEGGFLWAASLMWRMDRAWRSLGAAFTHLDQAPSTITREHFYFTTQPMDDAETPEQFLQAMQDLDELGLVDRIMFATDYPHWDFDAPDEAVPSIVPQKMRDKIFMTNALELYGFGPAPTTPGV